MRRKYPFILSVAIAFFAEVALNGCKPATEKVAVHPVAATDVPLMWADMALYITQHTPANSPTFASRALGYFGVTMYETIVHGYPRKRSLAGQLNQLEALPLPDSTKNYLWPLALNAGQALIIKNIYQQTSDENKLKIDSLERSIYEGIVLSLQDTSAVQRSVNYGRAVAAAIFEWSANDGGHRGYLHNFDANFQMPAQPGQWKAPFYAQTISRLPLHPHWGNNRTFLKQNSGGKMPHFLKYSKKEKTDYHRQFLEVYKANKNLTQEQKEIAMWWNDDPSDTYTPPGHSYNLASIVLRTQKADLMTSAEVYARTGMAVADAFIVCWKMKYKFCTERPSSFISENIDPAWESFWPDPPFPAFPSGHATQAGAVATVMADRFGERMDIIDNTHSKKAPDKLKNVQYKDRKFSSFWQIAEETARSRLYGGIHCTKDNEVGLSEGAKLGRHINSLTWNN